MTTETQTTTTEQPTYMLDENGNQIRIENIKPIDLERDTLVKKIVADGKLASEVLRNFKINTFADIGALVELAAEQYGAKVGGKKGNVTLYTFDKRYKVQRAMTENIVFDERLQAAKSLIDECLHEWTADANPNLQAIVNRAFEVDKEGNNSTGRVLSLRRLEITDARWVRAMQAISDSIQTIGSKAYVRLYERVGDTDEYVPIPLDVAGV